MFKTKPGFRSLVVASVLLGLLSQVINLVFPGLSPSELQMAFEKLGESREPSILLAGGFLIALVVAGLISTVGPLVFWKPARLLYVASLFGFCLVISIVGPQLMSGPSEAILLLSEFFAGIVAALMYTKPVSGYFEN